MKEIQWIKIQTDMFDNRKIKAIRRMKNGNDYVLIWIMLMTLAGQNNDGGCIYLAAGRPYTAEELAGEFGYRTPIVENALHAFSDLKMIDFCDDGAVQIINWEEYQNTETLKRIKEQNRDRKRAQREREKEKERDTMCDVTEDVTEDVTLMSHDVTEDVTLMSHDVTLENKNKNKNKNKIYKENREKCDMSRDTSRESPAQRYGEYSNVLLTDDQLEKLKTECPTNWTEWIERLSAYKRSTGKTYKDDLATIRNWKRRDDKERAEKEKSKPRPSYDVEAYKAKARGPLEYKPRSVSNGS